MHPRRCFIGGVLFLLACAGCGRPAFREESADAVRDAASSAIARLSTRSLPNAVRIHSRVISGGLPEGDAAFEELRALGVRTIISVDGARPDVAAAAKHGLRYVHLPHGYDGVSPDRARELAKAVRDLPGPIYVHCHHGKHRSPAAAAVACVGAGLIPPTAAAAVLETAGTSPHYRGLFQAAETARPFDAALLDALEAEFPAVAELPALAEAMVEMERLHDRVALLERASWRPPRSHPDLVPAHEALLLREQYTELLRSDSAASHPAEFRRLVSDGEQAARDLEAALAIDKLDDATKALRIIDANCKACHAAFRDNPAGVPAKRSR